MFHGSSASATFHFQSQSHIACRRFRCASSCRCCVALNTHIFIYYTSAVRFVSFPQHRPSCFVCRVCVYFVSSYRVHIYLLLIGSCFLALFNTYISLFSVLLRTRVYKNMYLICIGWSVWHWANQQKSVARVVL